MLTANQRKALAALLVSKSRAEASRRCGLGLRTLQDYEKNPEFAEALEKGRREALADAAHRIAAGYSETVDTLQEIVQNPGHAGCFPRGCCPRPAGVWPKIRRNDRYQQAP